MVSREKVEISVVRGEPQRVVRRLAAGRILLDYPDMPWRADPATGRASNGDIYSAVYSRLFVSCDGGRTWSHREIEFEGFNGCCGFGVLPDDTLLLMYATPAEGRAPYSDMRIARSTDLGKSWEPGEPLEIAPYDGAGADGNNFVVDEDGAVLVAICLRHGDGVRDATGQELPLEKKGIYDHIYRSRDGGKTWGDRSLIVPHSAESRLLHLGGKRMLAAIRYQRWFALPEDPLDLCQRTGGRSGIIWKHVFLADSDDNGYTWHNLRQLTSDFGDTPGELVRLSHGTLAVIYCHRYPYEAGNTQARVSRDGGKTWGEEKYIVSQGSGYSGSVVLEDDTIVTVCGCTRLRPDADPAEPGKSNAEPWCANVVRWRIG